MPLGLWRACPVPAVACEPRPSEQVVIFGFCTQYTPLHPFSSYDPVKRITYVLKLKIHCLHKFRQFTLCFQTNGKTESSMKRLLYVFKYSASVSISDLDCQVSKRMC